MGEHPCQPIAVRNVIGYLVGTLSKPEMAGGTFDIGGPNVLCYRDIMRVMAEELGLRRRWILPVPVLSPRLSSYWIHLITPLSHHIAKPLAIRTGRVERFFVMSARLSLKRRTMPYSERFAVWAVDTDGTLRTGSGESAVGSTLWLVAPAFAVDAGIRRWSIMGKRSTSGVLLDWNAIGD
jgi:hypothetical protein